jgi:glycosyltransferase involved in cell wall biosynthesis
MPALRVSVAFVAYNQERFVEEALVAALNQDYPSYEVVIGEDASTDGTRARIEAVLARGIRPEVEVVRLFHQHNLGLLGNLNSVFDRCRGDVIICMAGDDISYPGRIAKVAAAFEADQSLMLVTTEVRNIDEHGRPFAEQPRRARDRVFAHGLLIKGVFAGAPIAGAAASYRKVLVNFFGPMPPDAGGDDVCYFFRALLLGRVRFLSEPLMDYRQHSANLFNYAVGGMTEEEFRKRDMRHLAAHAAFPFQWKRDLERAAAQGRVGRFRRWLLAGRIGQHGRRALLTQYAMEVRPWSECLSVAAALCCRHGDIIKTLKLLWLRLLSSARKRYWASAWSRRTAS